MFLPCGRAGNNMSFMSRKYYSMLASGTLTTIVVSILLMADSLIAGYVVGQEAVAGITLVSPLYSLSAFCSSVFSLGFPIVYSAEMGSFRRKEADRVFGFCLLMSLVTGMLLFVSVLLFGERYLESSRQLPAVIAEARGYLSFMRFTFMLQPLNMLLSSAVYVDGDETITNLSSIVQCVGNVPASVIFGRLMGIRGVAMASFLFTVIATGILFLHFLKKDNSLRLNLYFSFGLMKTVVWYSFTDASLYLFSAVFTAAVNTFVTLYFGAEYLILVSVILLVSEFQMIYDGIGEAITPIIGVYLAEDCFPGVRAIYRLAKRTAIAEGLVVGVILFFIAPLIPKVLDITDPELVRISILGIRFLSLGAPAVSLLTLSSAYALLLDRVILGISILGLRDLVFPVLFSVLLGIVFGPAGFLFGLVLAHIVTWLVLGAYLRLKYGDDAPLLLKERERGREALLYVLNVEPYAVQRVRDEIGEALTARAYTHSTVNRVMLLFEELFMLIYEKNGEREIQGECTLLLEDGSIRMIIRDTGIVFDPTDDDMAITNIGSHVLLSFAERVSDQKLYLMTMSFNRTTYALKAQKEAR